MKQRAYVWENADVVRSERVEDVAKVLYERKDGDKFHQRTSSLIEFHEDRWWGFLSLAYRTSHRLLLSANHGLPVEPRYGSRYGWRGPDPDDEESKKLSRHAHEVANAQAKSESFGSVTKGFRIIQKPVDLFAILMLCLAVGALGFRAYEWMVS